MAIWVSVFGVVLGYLTTDIELYSCLSSFRYLAHPSGAQLARTAAYASSSIDFVIADCEQGLIPLHGGAQDTVAGIRGTASFDRAPSSLIRISAGDEAGQFWQIKLALDSGAHGK